MPNDFTPQQIEEFLQEFFDVVGTRQYTGARYVPIFGRAGSDTVEWDDTAPYEPLTVVMHQGVSYVSRRYVPTGIQITDTAYWVETYRFNAQVEQYRQEVISFQAQIDQVRDDMESDYVPFPDGVTYPKYGTRGQVLATLADGSTKWDDPVTVDAAIAGPLIDEWLTDHPEATTTVEDHSITDAKIYVDSCIPRSNGIFNPADPQFDDVDDFMRAGSIYIGRSVTSAQCANLPRYGTSGLLVIDRAQGGGYAVTQTIYYEDGTIYTRFNLAGTISDWRKVDFPEAYASMLASDVMTSRGTWTPSTFSDCDAVPVAGSYYISANDATEQNLANLPLYGKSCTLLSFDTHITGSSKTTLQVATYPTIGYTYVRSLVDTGSAVVASDWSYPMGTWSDQNVVHSKGRIDPDAPLVTNLNMLYQAGCYFFGSTVSSAVVSNLPKYGTACEVTVLKCAVASGQIAATQLAAYTDGSVYARLVYGSSNNPTATPWAILSGSKAYYTVGTGSGHDFTTLVDAANTVPDGSTIVVFPGTYEGTLRLTTKELNILGVNPATCIVLSRDGRYSYPAMECNAGHFENLTFAARYESGISQEIGTDSGAYAVHVEGAGAGQFSVGKSVSFAHCRFESDFFSALGVGTSKDWTLTLDECELVGNQPANRGPYVSDGGLGALYVHDAAGTIKGHSDVRVRNCVIRTTVLSNTISMSDLQEPDNSVDFEFTNNTIYSATEGFNDSIFWRRVTTPWGGNLHLLPWSNGNTETELNA